MIHKPDVDPFREGPLACELEGEGQRSSSLHGAATLQRKFFASQESCEVLENNAGNGL